MAQLKHWCKGEGINPLQAILLKDVPEDTEIDLIEKTLQSIKVLGRVKVRGRMYDPQCRGLTVLCECRETVDTKAIPLDVLPEGSVLPWRIFGPSEEENESTVEAESGAVQEQPQVTAPASPLQASTPEAIIRAVGDILQKNSKSSNDISSYRRLRTFSGVAPTPAGEEQLDNWIEQARLMIEEYDRPDREKKMRLMESVKGPALEILQAVRFNNPDATSADYIDVIENTFGTPETGEELYFAFRMLSQHSGEKLSEFLRRMEKLLNKVVQKGGLPPASIDKARLDQLIKGATRSDMMLLRLRLRERKNNPPTFLELLQEVRVEEEYEASRRRLAPTKSVHVKSATIPTDPEMKELRTEIQELRSKVSELTALSAAPCSPSSELPPTVTTTAESSGDERNIQALKKEVVKLRKKVSSMTVQSAAATQAAVPNRETFTLQQTQGAPTHKDSRGFFCYRCGEDGHISSKCTAPENYPKVIQKLIQSQRKLKSTQRSPTTATEVTDPSASVKTTAVNVKENGLPEGLVGPLSTASAKVNGIPCTALLDSGSQVTIVFDTWYAEHLSHVTLHPISGLDLWGLSDKETSYPYSGYIQITLELPEKTPGKKAKSVPVLALVCPDLRCSDEIPVLVGTNVEKVRALTSQKVAANPDSIQSLRVCVYEPQAHPLPSTQSPHSNPDDSSVAEVRWCGPGPLIVPAGSEYIAICKVKETQSLGDSILITERAPSPALPPSVLVQPTVLFSKMMDKNKFLVLMRNESLKDTSIPKGTIIAHLHVADMVTEIVNSQPENPPKIDVSLFDFGDSPISSDWKERLQKQLSERSNVFSTEEWDVGLAKGVEHRIRLTDKTPFRERSRRVSPADLDDLRCHLQGLLAAGVIKESRSPYASPIVLARKKSGKLRMCVDYRTLNQRTIPDQYTVPRIDDALDSLAGSKWFSVLDLRSGYYQIPMAEEDKEKTAFICPLGFYQFERMPQGITGAPATFQRLMEKAVGDMHMLEVIVYLDDLIVFGRTLEEHEQRLFKVLDRLEETGLKLSIDKCQFCRPQVTYVGHIVSENGISTDPAKVEAVAHWKQPTDLHSLQSFLGFCGYYRRFIKNYSIIVRPLTDLCKGYPPTQKKKKNKVVSDKPYYKVSESFGDRWDQSCTDAFQKIIQCLTNAPVLAFADPSRPYVLHVDASLHGLGAVLNQEQPEGLRPVAFASRKLSSSEKNYPVHQLEFLALKWAVVDKFHDYLYGAQFLVRTDNNPLTYILTTAKLNATGHRWLAALSTYNFSLQYRPGSSNIDADSLSRNPLSTNETEWQNLPPDSVKALCKQVRCGKPAGEPNCAEPLGVSPDAIPECYAFPTRLDLGCLIQLSHKDLVTAQNTDSVIATVKKTVKEGRQFHSVKCEDPRVTLLQREMNKLLVVDDLLYRVKERPPGTEVRQLVLPSEYVPMVLKSLHDESGHLGVEKTSELIRDRFYWPKMGAEIEQYVKNCGRCIARKTPPQRAATLNQITSKGPLDLVCIDFLSLEPDSQGFANVLVVTDHFTRYAQAFPARDQKASTVAKILSERYFVHYGLPARIHSDQGRDFESKLIRDLLRMLGIRKSRTSPYHPQGDPQPERFNRTLLSMLGTLDPCQKQKWSQNISQLVHAYNCTKNEATGYSPYLLMFGREARLPVDICFGVSKENDEGVAYLQYVAKLRTGLHKAYQLATEAADKSHKRNKKAHDRLVKEQVLEEGDRVLLRNFGVTGKHKLKDKWRSTPYLVVGKMPNLPVYRVKPEIGSGCVKTIHRNHLLPIGYLVRLPSDQDDLEQPQRPLTRAQGHVQSQTQTFSIDDAPYSSESDYEDVDPPRPLTVGWRDLLPQSELVARPQRHVISEVQDPPVARNLTGVDLCSETSNILDAAPYPPTDPDTERDVEGGADVREDGGVEEDESRVERSRRVKKPVIRLSYDELGRPSDQPVTVLSHGVFVGSGIYRGLRSQPCSTAWCHPMALCPRCFSLSPLFSKQLQVV